ARDTMSATRPHVSEAASAVPKEILQPTVHNGSLAHAHDHMVQTGKPAGMETPPYMPLAAQTPSLCRPMSGFMVATYTACIRAVATARLSQSRRSHWRPDCSTPNRHHARKLCVHGAISF